MVHVIEVMNGTGGRLARIVLGLALIVAGVLLRDPVGIGLTIGLAAVGILLLGVALAGHCVLELFVRTPHRPPAGSRP